MPPRSSHEGECRGRTKNRIKRSSFTHEVKKLQKGYPAVLIIPTLPLSKQDFTNPCEKTSSEIQIKTTIPQLDQGKELNASIRRSLALVNIAENYPPETWTHVQQPRQLQTAALVSSSSIPVVQHRLPFLPQGSTVPTIEQKQRHLSRQ